MVFPGSQLRIRTLSAIFLLPLVMVALVHRLSFIALILVTTILALWEWQCFLKDHFTARWRWLTSFFLIILTSTGAILFIGLNLDNQLLIKLIFFFICTIYFVEIMEKIYIWLPLRIIALWLPAISLIALYDGSYIEGLSGLESVVLLLLIISFSDTGAYLMGQWWGGSKLAPRISPGKTWAGLWGGIIAATVAGAIFLYIYNLSLTLLVIVVWIALAGVIGDILVSAVKRHFSCKDSSGLIPGHGGILDRYDSYILAAPAAWIGLTLWP